jgi:hypothetical protein
MTSARDVFDEGDKAYAELAAALDADPGRVLHGEGGAAWTARDVYVHLYRWQQWAVDALAHSLETGDLVEAYADESEMEALNARWQVEGSGLSLAAAKALCEQSREPCNRLSARFPTPTGRDGGPKMARSSMVATTAATWLTSSAPTDRRGFLESKYRKSTNREIG